MEIKYRIANKLDWTALGKFRNQYSCADAEVDYQHFSQDFQNTTQKNLGSLFVATFENTIVGYARVGEFRKKLGFPIYGLLDEVPDGFYLKGILVDDDVRGRGVATELTNLRHSFVFNQASSSYCILHKDNKVSMNFHLRLGYKIEIENLPYQGDQESKPGVLLSLKREEITSRG